LMWFGQLLNSVYLAGFDRLGNFFSTFLWLCWLPFEWVSLMWQHIIFKGWGKFIDKQCFRQMYLEVLSCYRCDLLNFSKFICFSDDKTIFQNCWADIVILVLRLLI
jgi:hypothetical protein